MLTEEFLDDADVSASLQHLKFSDRLSVLCPSLSEALAGFAPRVLTDKETVAVEVD